MTTHQREQLFGAGVTVGLLLGFVLGSLLATRLGNDLLDLANRLFQRLSERQERVNFELLLQ